METPAITPTGANWLTVALDPFHDFTTPIQGLPDGNCTPSFTRVHTQTLAFGATVAGDEIRVSFDGLHGTALNYMKSHNSLLSGSINWTAATAGLAPVTVVRSNAGFCGLSTVGAGLGTLIGSLALTPDISTPSRVIALGLEIHDTTAQLNRQGIVGVVHIPGQVQTDCSRQVWTAYGAATSILDIIGHMTLTPALPTNKAQASLIPGYVEWECSKGVYVTGRLQCPQKPVFFQVLPGIGSGACPSMENRGVVTEIAGALPSTDQETWVYPTPNPASLDTLYWSHNPVQIYPSFYSGFQPFTVWLSGLAATSTFRLVLRTVVEYFPEVTDTTAIANAVSVPPYDPGAFIQYHRARSVLPQGVPVGMNAKGDWWRMVKQAFRVGGSLAMKAAPAALALAGMPVAASGAQLLTNAFGQTLTPRVKSRPKNKAKKKRPGT